MGITYEEMRLFYDAAEQREQAYIVMIQKLMNENKELKKAYDEIKRYRCS